MNHRVATGEPLELTTDQRRRHQLLTRTMTALVILIVVLVIGDIILSLI